MEKASPCYRHFLTDLFLPKANVQSLAFILERAAIGPTCDIGRERQENPARSSVNHDRSWRPNGHRNIYCADTWPRADLVAGVYRLRPPEGGRGELFADALEFPLPAHPARRCSYYQDFPSLNGNLHPFVRHADPRMCVHAATTRAFMCPKLLQEATASFEHFLDLKNRFELMLRIWLIPGAAVADGGSWRIRAGASPIAGILGIAEVVVTLELVAPRRIGWKNCESCQRCSRKHCRAGDPHHEELPKSRLRSYVLLHFTPP